jgi:hypothetical protein
MIALRSIVPPPPSPDRRGTVLVGILVGLMLLASALVAVAISGRREQDLTLRRMESMRAAYAEEAGAQIAVRELITQQDDDGDGIIGEVAAGNLASGIIIGTSRAAADASASGSTWTILPQGSNGLATRAGSINLGVTNYVPGLYVECFQLGSAPTTVGGITWTNTPTAVGIVPNVLTAVSSGTPMWVGGPTNNYALRFRGTITIPTAGSWTFSTTSNDGSVLWINGVQVVDNDGVHAWQTRSGSITLPAGTAFFDLRYFNLSADGSVSVSWSGPGVATQTIPATAFTCDPFRAVPPVAGTTSMSLAGATLNGYFSKSGAYGGANITSNFSVQTNATTMSAINVTNGTLSANALCGIGGTPSIVITTGAGGSISGTSLAATSRVAIIGLTPPLNTLATSGVLSVTGTTTIASDVRYSSVTLNTLNAKIVVSGHRVMQCDGNLTIGSNCSIELEANSSLRLYITSGNLAISGTAQVNANTADPTRFRIFFTAMGRTMTMTGSAVFHGYVFNRDGGLTITGGSTPAPTFFGVYHGTTISTTSTALFRADASFGSTTASTNLLTTWRQTQ